MAERTPLILDVDTGIDDSLALLYVAASPDAEIVAATCVSGNVPGRRSASTPAQSSNSPGRPRSRSRWAARPRSSARSRPPPRRTARKASDTPSCRHRPARRYRHAVDLILDEVRRRPGEIALVTLGPLTNLALAPWARSPPSPACSRATR